MNKRIKKKISRIKEKQKAENPILVSDKICPICGSYTALTGETYYCCFCERHYKGNEVATSKREATVSEIQEIQRTMKDR